MKNLLFIMISLLIYVESTIDNPEHFITSHLYGLDGYNREFSINCIQKDCKRKVTSESLKQRLKKFVKSKLVNMINAFKMKSSKNSPMKENNMDIRSSNDVTKSDGNEAARNIAKEQIWKNENNKIFVNKQENILSKVTNDKTNTSNPSININLETLSNYDILTAKLNDITNLNSLCNSNTNNNYSNAEPNLKNKYMDIYDIEKNENSAFGSSFDYQFEYMDEGSTNNVRYCQPTLNNAVNNDTIHRSNGGMRNSAMIKTNVSQSTSLQENNVGLIEDYKPYSENLLYVFKKYISNITSEMESRIIKYNMELHALRKIIFNEIYKTTTLDVTLEKNKNIIMQRTISILNIFVIFDSIRQIYEYTLKNHNATIEDLMKQNSCSFLQNDDDKNEISFVNINQCQNNKCNQKTNVEKQSMNKNKYIEMFNSPEMEKYNRDRRLNRIKHEFNMDMSWCNEQEKIKLEKMYSDYCTQIFGDPCNDETINKKLNETERNDLANCASTNYPVNA